MAADNKEFMTLSTPLADKRRTLLISHDVIGAKMAGPGIRYFHLSRVLGRYTELRLAIRPESAAALTAVQSNLPDVTVIAYQRGDWDSLRQAAEWAETIILSPYAAIELPQVADLPAAIVMDGYDPLLVEWLTTLPPDQVEPQTTQWYYRTMALFFQYLIGDFYICASDRQRYWWLGQLEVAGRINPATYHRDPSLRNLIDVVPYGLPEREPVQGGERPYIKGIWPGIAPDDVLLLWGGGLWPWLDPMTAVRALAQLHPTHPHLKLIFPGTKHPNPDVHLMPVHNTQVYTYAQETGLLGKAIFWGEWIPYQDWPHVLRECDIALSLHQETVETSLAFRSRMLEYIWAGLPTIATQGDATSELLQQYHLGVVVDYQDVSGVVAAILHLLGPGKGEFQSGLAAARQELTWEKAAQPLIRFCQHPYRAADRPMGKAGGIPFYKAQLIPLEQLVTAYEKGKFMRFMKRVHEFRARWWPSKTNQSR